METSWTRRAPRSTSSSRAPRTRAHTSGFVEWAGRVREVRRRGSPFDGQPASTSPNRERVRQVWRVGPKVSCLVTRLARRVRATRATRAYDKGDAHMFRTWKSRVGVLALTTMMVGIPTVGLAGPAGAAGADKFDLLGPHGGAFCDGSHVVFGAPGGFGFAVINAPSNGTVETTVSLKG